MTFDWNLQTKNWRLTKDDPNSPSLPTNKHHSTPVDFSEIHLTIERVCISYPKGLKIQSHSENENGGNETHIFQCKKIVWTPQPYSNNIVDGWNFAPVAKCLQGLYESQVVWGIGPLDSIEFANNPRPQQPQQPPPQQQQQQTQTPPRPVFPFNQKTLPLKTISRKQVSTYVQWVCIATRVLQWSLSFSDSQVALSQIPRIPKMIQTCTPWKIRIIQSFMFRFHVNFSGRKSQNNPTLVPITLRLDEFGEFCIQLGDFKPHGHLIHGTRLWHQRGKKNQMMLTEL